jgi:hypothetical protein
MSLRELLLRTYPRSWRAEYGEEFAAILAHTKLTPRIATDVVRGAAIEHLRRDDPWKICATGLFLWGSFVVFSGWDVLEPVWISVLVLTGAWTIRQHGGMLEATRASALVSVIAFVPDMLSTPLHPPPFLPWPVMVEIYALWAACGVMLGLFGALAAKAWDRLSHNRD